MMRQGTVIAAFLILGFDTAHAISAADYQFFQESIFIALSVGCIILAAMIFAVHKGGSLGLPWVFLMIGFGLAGIHGLMLLLENMQIVLHQYDLRVGFLLTRSGSMLFFVTGLFLYKRGLG
jgi:hypothetical protein